MASMASLTPPGGHPENRELERWFRRRGLPYLYTEYRATTGIFTRLAPVLALVFFVEVFVTFGDQFSGWSQAGIVVAGLAFLAAVAVGVNRLRGRPAFALPDDVGPLELVAFIFAPGAFALIVGDEVRALAVIAANIVILGAGFVVFGYALGPMIVRAGQLMVSQIGDVARLVARSLPILLLFSAFLFLNAEMWQVAHDFPPAFYGIVVGSLVGVGLAFVALRIPRETDGLARFGSWSEVGALCDGAPVAVPPAVTAMDHEPLRATERFNVALLLFVAQAFRILTVAVGIGVFYVGFGLLTVRGETIAQWTTTEEPESIGRFFLFSSEVVVTWEHLAVAGFIAAFSALQFAVSSLTDESYREEFFADVTTEMRQALAVRAAHLASGR
jgi:hypothetical protein